MKIDVSFCLTILFHVAFYFAEANTTSDQLRTIFLRLYGETSDDYLDVTLDNVLLLLSKMKQERPTVLYIHGYTESAESESVQTVAREYLQRGDHNVLIADYRNISNMRYAKVAKSVGDVGKAFALALNEMVLAGLDFNKLHIVGHSIGSQVASHIGKQTSFQVSRITGLDPAGPFFNFLEAHLSAADARFVDIIHTDYGIYGIARTTGTVDFFPNGGHRIQPGCSYGAAFFSAEDFCSHRRSWKFYAESVGDERSFIATKCPSHYQFVAGECNDNANIIMGLGTPSNAEGTFYLVTAADAPFGLKEKGARA